MHDPFAIRDRHTEAAPRPSVRRIRAWVTIAMVMALVAIAVALLGLFWEIVNYVVRHAYRDFGGRDLTNHMFDGGRRVLLILSEIAERQ